MRKAIRVCGAYCIDIVLVPMIAISISKLGLPGIILVMALQVMCLYIIERLHPAHRVAIWAVLLLACCSILGLLVGHSYYPTPTSPPELGNGVVLVCIVVDMAVIGIADGIIMGWLSKKERRIGDVK